MPAVPIFFVQEGVDMISILAVCGCFVTYMIGIYAGIEIGSKETLRQIEREAENDVLKTSIIPRS